MSEQQLSALLNYLETDSELFKELCDGDINVERLLSLTRGAGFNLEQTEAEVVIAKTMNGLSDELNRYSC